MNVCSQIGPQGQFRWGTKQITPSGLRTAKKPRSATTTPAVEIVSFSKPKCTALASIRLRDGHHPGHCRDVRSFAVVESKDRVGSFLVREAEEKDLHQAAEVMAEAYTVFYSSLGQDLGVNVDVTLTIARDLHAPPLKRLFVAVSVDGKAEEGDVIGVAGLRVEDPVAGFQWLAVSTPKSGRGVGRALTGHALDIGRQRGENSMVCLLQDPSNSAAFGLYSSMGYRVVESFVWLQGFVSDDLAEEAIGAVEETGTYFRKMEEGDVAKCDDMCMNVIGHSRLNDIKGKQKTTEPQPCIVGAQLTDSGGEEVVAYCTSFALSGHSVSVDEQHFKALLSFGSKLAKSEGRNEPMFLCLSKVNPDIIQWALKAGLRVERQLSLMVYGGSISINPEYVYTAGTDY